jgi:hypothetical protein
LHNKHNISRARVPGSVTRQNPLQRLGDMCALSGMADHSGQQIGRSVGPQNELTSSCIWISTGVQVSVFEFNVYQLSISCSHTRCQSTPCCTTRSLYRTDGYCKLHSLKATNKALMDRSLLADQGSSECIRQMRMHSKESLSASKTRNHKLLVQSSTLQAEAQQCL